MKNKCEVADIFRLYGKEYREKNNLAYKKLKVMHKIEICRTAQLGGHIEQCDERCVSSKLSPLPQNPLMTSDGLIGAHSRP